MKTTFQIIKAFAIVLAVMIIVSIIGAVVTGVEMLGMLGSERDHDEYTLVADAGYSDVKELDINVKATELKIVETDKELVRVETTSKYIDQWQDQGTLHVTERSHGIFGWNAVGLTTIYLPKNTHFERVRLEVGAGSLTVETDLNAKKAKLDFGAGRAMLDGLYVSESAEIDAGAGLLEIHGGKVKDLNLDMGAGKAVVDLRLAGNNHIQTGAGKLELGLLGGKSDYTVAVNKGIGSVALDGANLGDNEEWGKGVNKVKIESGVGAIEIRTNSEKEHD